MDKDSKVSVILGEPRIIDDGNDKNNSNGHQGIIGLLWVVYVSVKCVNRIYLYSICNS